ncbi:MAG: hypothetical protein GC206_06240 [Alphaproteobacteria bacterium]|nr:hypothetical protein [Alphaproteobacteria bacterium]
MTGRAGLSDLAAVVEDVCGDADADASALAGAVGGYVIDAPTSAREALAPLMAAYDFVALEREGALVFQHRDARAPLAAVLRAERVDAGAAEVSREDGADTPVEARVRFIDPQAEYRVGQASARRRDAAEGGVVSLDAPLALDEAQAERLAKRALASARAGIERAEAAIAPQALGLEPGDVITLEGEAGAFEIVRSEEAETRRLALRRAESTGLGRMVYAGEAGVGDAAGPAPTPALAALDLPPLPGAEDDVRPLAAVRAAPWKGAHEVYAGSDAALATRRARALQPAIIGELVWALYPGPVGRWDDGNRIRVRMTGALTSVSKSAALNGANTFAVATEGGWELVQARNAVLVGENEYELSGFLRGLGDTDDAMGAPAPVGAHIVKVDARLARIDVAAHEWGEPIILIAPPVGGDTTSADSESATAVFAPRAARPFAPCFLRADVLGGDVRISWIRRARVGGDAWGVGEPPIGAAREAYRIEILDGSDVVRTAEVDSAEYLYEAADIAADLGSPSAITLRVAQIDETGGPGRWTQASLAI